MPSFSRENIYLAVGTEDGEVYIWTTSEFSIHKKYQVGSCIKCIDYSPDGTKLAIGGTDRKFQIIDTTTGLAVFCKTLNSGLTALKWSKYLLVVGCENGNLLIWNIVEVKLLYEFEAHKGEYNWLKIYSYIYVYIYGLHLIYNSRGAI